MTASYVSMEMAALHEKAKQANVTLLCEMGLDPGIGIILTTIPSLNSINITIKGHLKLLFFRSHDGHEDD